MKTTFVARLKSILFISIAGVLSITDAYCEAPFSIPTYHCLSVYWNPDNSLGGQPVSVEYRVSGDATWLPALSMRYRPSASPEAKADYRGSIVNLRPDTTYQIRLKVGESGESEVFTAKTRNEDFPVKTAIKVGNRNATLNIDSSGTATGYILYDGTGSTIDLGNLHDQGIAVNGSYVILRGFTIKNVRKHGIELLSGSNIVIEECDISQWGEEEENGFGYNIQAGIYSKNTTLSGVTIQRCKIHHPNWDTNSWDELHNGGNHPAGPQAIAFSNSEGNHVIRYNEVWSDADHYFNDILGFAANSSYRGFPGADSDIYGNYLANAHDDGIEAEGGNQNVRIWNNYIENTYIAIGNAATSVGPLYFWRNVIGKTELYGVKMGYAGSISWMTGEMFFFHNTFLPLSGGLGTTGSGLGRQVLHCTTRNNNFNIRIACTLSISGHSSNIDNSFDFDLSSSAFPTGSGSHVLVSAPTYVAPVLFDPGTLRGNFQLVPGTPGFDTGMIIPNFTGEYLGSGPDRGAHENGTPEMVFGVDAYFEPPLVNNLPLVGAYPPTQNVLLTGTAHLSGMADWIVHGSLVVYWSKVSGPGTVSFSSPSALDTTATLSEAGTYLLRFEAADSSTSSQADVTVIVKENGQPTAVASPLTATVALEAPTRLTGIATDDGLPGPLMLTWRKISGPGTITFSDDDLLTTLASFSQVGTYMIKFKAHDGLLYGARNITLNVVNNQKPAVTALPTTQTILLSQQANLVATATDDGLPEPLTLTWQKKNGPGTVTFSNPNSLSTTATFSAVGTYTLKFTASDSLLDHAKNVTVVVQ